MKISTIVLSLAAVMTLFPGSACCGDNAYGRAWLSWDPAQPSCNYSIMPTGQVYLYVQLGDIVGLRGCEFILLSGTAGPPWGTICHEFVLGEHPSGSGDDCTWIMRGTQVLGIDQLDADSWYVAFCSESECCQCETGNIARVLVDFSGCDGELPTGFCLIYVKVTDCSAVLDYLQVTSDAMILDPGGYWNCPCSFERCSGCNWATSIERTGWGSIKAMYK